MVNFFPKKEIYYFFSKSSLNLTWSIFVHKYAICYPVVTPDGLFPVWITIMVIPGDITHRKKLVKSDESKPDVVRWLCRNISSSRWIHKVCSWCLCLSILNSVSYIHHRLKLDNRSLQRKQWQFLICTRKKCIQL